MSKLCGKMKIIPFVIILGVLAVLATVLIFHGKNGDGGVGGSGQSGFSFSSGSGKVYNHATDYDCEIGDMVFPDDHWTVHKVENDGVVTLHVWNSGADDNVMAKEYSYTVYDSEEEAREVFEAGLERYREINRDFEEGKDWFVSEEPAACDARVIFMNYLEKNVIISCELEVWGEWAVSVDDPVGNTYYDNTDKKEYCIKHASELRKYVIKNVLGLD